MRKTECHIDRPHYCKGLCRSCYEKQLKIKNPEYKERQLKNNIDWINKNKEYKKEYDRRYNAINPIERDKKYFSTILRKFGITKDQYLELINKCNNTCYICGRKPHKNKRLHLDHCHKSNKVRGILCTRCNWYLATIENDITILDKIKIYLNERTN